MEKVIRDGRVAVLYSPGYGAGWYTWNTDYPQLLFHPTLVEMVEQGKAGEIDEELCKRLLGLNEEDSIYTGGAYNLRILWLPEGTGFYIDEYDGAESVVTTDNIAWVIA